MLQSIFVFTTIAVVIIGFPIFLVYLMCVWNFDQTSHENLQKNVINHAKRFGAYIKTLSTSRPVKVVASILSVLLVSLSIYADFAGVGLAPQVEPGQVSTCKSDETVCIVVVDFFEVNRTATTKAGMQIAQEIYSGLTDLDPKQSQFVVIQKDDEFRSIDSTERALAAEELAKDVHADIVIYGVVKLSDKAWEIAPEFLVNIKNNYEIQEVVGQYQLGTPFLIGDPNDLTGRIERTGILHARVEALYYITLGLAKYASNKDFIEAAEDFQKAIDIAKWNDTEGKEIVYVLLGNALGKSNNFEQAEQYYIAAQSVNQDYSRVYAGLGNLYYSEAVRLMKPPKQDVVCKWDAKQSIEYGEEIVRDASLLLDQAEQYYQKATEAAIKPPLSDIDAKIHFGLGRIYFTQAYLLNGLNGDLAPAASELTRVIAYYNNDKSDRLLERTAEAYSMLGLIYRLHGDNINASQKYQNAIELVEGISSLQEHLGRYLAALGDVYQDANRLVEASANYRRASQLTRFSDSRHIYNSKLECVQQQLGAP